MFQVMLENCTDTNNQGYNLWQRSRLQFAEFDKQRGVHDVDVRWNGQLEKFSKDHLKEEKHINILNQPFFIFYFSQHVVC